MNLSISEETKEGDAKTIHGYNNPHFDQERKRKRVYDESEKFRRNTLVFRLSTTTNHTAQRENDTLTKPRIDDESRDEKNKKTTKSIETESQKTCFPSSSWDSVIQRKLVRAQYVCFCD